MNQILLNTIPLSDEIIVHKVIEEGEEIVNQSKEVEITANGETTIIADDDYTGLSEVKITCNVPTEKPFYFDYGKDVNFRDYDGTLLYSYTWAEAKALTALPALPTRDGMTYEEWNYTLAELKEQCDSENINYGKAEIGACCHTTDKKTRLYITVEEDTLSTPVYLVFTQSSASQLSINWGDGSIAQTSNIAGNNVLSYTYSQAGDYVITLTNNGSQEILLGGYNTAPNITNTSTNLLTPANDENHVNLNRLKRVEHGLHFAITDLTYRMFNNLQSMNIPRSDSFSYRTFERLRVNYLCLPKKRENDFIGTNGFKDGCFYTVSLPSDGKDYNKPFVNARLATFIIPKKAYLSESSFENAELLKCYNVSQSTTLASKVFYNCKDLKSISITSTVTIIKANALYGCSSLTTVDFSHHTTVPILEATSAFTATNDNLRILVPSTLYETWIAATNWSSLASKIEAV